MLLLTLPFKLPIGVFWDIQNCPVPSGKSATVLVKNIREKFFENHREAEFVCVCDVNGVNKNVIDELILAQVTVVHMPATIKNSADFKLKQCMKRFVNTHRAPLTLILISGDGDFASDLAEFRERHKIRIVLIHRGQVHRTLIACAHENYTFSTIAPDLTSRIPAKPSDSNLNVLLATDLPTNKNPGETMHVLKEQYKNYDGRVSTFKTNKAFINSPTATETVKAQNKLDKKYVCGKEISATFDRDNEFNFTCSSPQSEINEIPELCKRNRNRDTSFTSLGEKAMPTRHLCGSELNFLQSPAVDYNISPVSRNSFTNKKCTISDMAVLPCMLGVHKDLKYQVNNIITLLKENGSVICMSSIERLYEERYRIPLCIYHHNFQDIPSMIQKFPEHFAIKGNGVKRKIHLISGMPDDLTENERKVQASNISGSNTDCSASCPKRKGVHRNIVRRRLCSKHNISPDNLNNSFSDYARKPTITKSDLKKDCDFLCDLKLRLFLFCIVQTIYYLI